MTTLMMSPAALFATLAAVLIAGGMLAAILAPRRHLRTEILIDAAPKDVWSLIADPARHRDWNPNLHRMTGRLAKGEVFTMTLGAAGKRPMTFHPRVLDRAEGSHITWRGRLWFPGIFDGTHSLRIEPLGPRQTRFVNEEGFVGLLLWVMDTDQFRPDFEAANAGLKRLAEDQTR